MKPWIMTYREAYANCCLFGGHRKTVHVLDSQFGIPFVGVFSIITSSEYIKQVFLHPIIIAPDNNPSPKETLFVALCFRPRDSQIECYIHTEQHKRILHSSYQIQPYTPVFIFVQGDMRTMQYSLSEGSAPPYTTVCTFTPKTRALGFPNIDADVYGSADFQN